MSEKLPNEDRGKQALDRELADELRNYAGLGFGEDGKDTVIQIQGDISETPIKASGPEKSSKINNSQLVEESNLRTGETSHTFISKDTVVEHRKGRIIPPRLPRDEVQSAETSAGIVDSRYSGKVEAGFEKIGRRASVRETMGAEGEASAREASVEVVKSTTHAPRGMEGQEYHHRGFQDSPGETAQEKEERYSQLLMELAAKQVKKAKESEIWGGEIEDDPPQTGIV